STHVDRLVADPAFGTIEDLLSGDAHHGAYGRLIVSPAMTALRRIEIAHPRALDTLRESPAKLEHVAHAVRLSDVARASDQRGTDPNSLLDLLVICEGRPEVASLAFNAQHLDLVLESPIAPRLTAVAVRASLREIDALTQRLPRHIAMTIVPHPALDDCAPGPAPSIGGVELVSSRVVRAWGHWGHYALLDYLESQPSHFDRIEVCGRPDQFDEYERAAQQLRFELVVVPARPRRGYITLRGRTG